MTSRLCAALLGIALLLSGCADIKYTMRLDPAQQSGVTARVWPGGADKPRFRYTGQLTGEDNFVSDAADARNSGMKFLHWLVGLVGSGDDRLELARPQSGMVDAQGRVYVTDTARHAVFVFDPVAGKLQLWERALENTDFVTPIGIVQGGRGEILVVDADLGGVFRLDRDGKPLGLFGLGVLERPTGIARDARRQRIYVADTHAHDIKVFDDDGRLLQTLGRRGDGDGDGEMNFPTHLTFAEDRLYVADSMNARVLILDAQGKQLGAVGRRGRFVGNLSRPKGVSVDVHGNIYVVESFYDNLLIFNNQGKFLMPIGGTGKEIGQFYLPSGVWNDPQGRVYVADMFNGRVMIFQLLEGE